MDVKQDVAEKCGEAILKNNKAAKILPIVCDVADPLAVDAMVEVVKSKFGGIHILLNNAATKTSELKNLIIN